MVWAAPAAVLCALVMRDQQYSLAKVASGSAAAERTYAYRIECGRWASVPVKPRDRVSVHVDTWRLRTPLAGCLFPPC